MSRFLLLALIGASTAACTPLDPAPTDLDSLLQFFFAGYEGDPDERVIEGALNAELWFDENVEGSDQGGSASDIEDEHIAALGLEPQDKTWMHGVYHFIEQECSIDELDEIYFHPQQTVLFPDNYVDYTRTYGENRECYASGECPVVDWVIDVEDRLVGQALFYSLNSGLRRVYEHEGLPDGRRILLSRTWMPEPAQVGEDGGGVGFFDQSYQIELFLERPGGTTLHLYGLWNSGGLNGTDPESPLWENEYLDGIVEWDERLDAICADPDLPPPQ